MAISVWAGITEFPLPSPSGVPNGYVLETFNNQYILAPISTGTIGGSIAATQIAYGSGANAITGTNNATLDASGNAILSTLTASGVQVNGNITQTNSGGSAIQRFEGIGDGYTYTATQYVALNSGNIWEFDFNAPNNGDQTMAFHYALNGSFFGTPVWILVPPISGEDGKMGINLTTPQYELDVLGRAHIANPNLEFFLCDPTNLYAYLGDISGTFGNHTYIEVNDSGSVININGSQVHFTNSAPTINALTASRPVFTDGSNTLISATAANIVAAGIPQITSGRFTAQTAAKTNIVPYTVGAADSSFLIWANILVTASTLNSFTTTVTYTDESNTSRVLTLNFSQLTGAFITTITNATGAAPYEGVPVGIRCKAGTTITISTTGTFTTVTYNVEAFIQQTK